MAPTAQASQSRALYVNTLIFSIIAGVVSFALLIVLIFASASREFAYGIVTFELGLIGVILYLIISIYLYERKLRETGSDNNKFIVAVDTCPDYFSNSLQKKPPPGLAPAPGSRPPAPCAAPGTSPAPSGSPESLPKDSPVGSIMCNNGYASVTGDKMYYFVRRGCKAKTPSDPACAIIDDGRNNATTYSLSLNDYNKSTSTKICERVNASGTDKEFANVPWTDIKARCNSLSLGETSNFKGLSSAVNTEYTS